LEGRVFCARSTFGISTKVFFSWGYDDVGDVFFPPREGLLSPDVLDEVFLDRGGLDSFQCVLGWPLSADPGSSSFL